MSQEVIHQVEICMEEDPAQNSSQSAPEQGSQENECLKRALNRSNQRKPILLIALVVLVVLTLVAVAALVAVQLNENEIDAVEAEVLSSQSQNFLDISRVNDANNLYLAIPSSSLNKPFAVHAIFHKGPFTDNEYEAGEEQQQELLWNNLNLATSDRYVFHFELEDNARSIQYVREQWKIRTKHKQMKKVVEEGTWVGYDASLKIVRKTRSRKSRGIVYIVNATRLLNCGFYTVEYDQTNAKLMLSESKAYRNNLNIVVDYGFYGDGSVQYSLFFCIAALPETLMTSRIADDRIGYFSNDYIDVGGVDKTAHSIQIQKSKPVRMINKHWLDVDNHGNCRNTITFYVDPSVPTSWRSTVKEAVEEWQTAFTDTGISNAIRAVLPGDKDWPRDYQIGDIRFLTISLALDVSSGVLGIGPSISDPRTGQILGANIVLSSAFGDIYGSAFDQYIPLHDAHSNKLDKGLSVSMLSKIRNSEKVSHVAVQTQKAIDNARATDKFLSHVVNEFILETPGHLFSNELKSTVTHEVGHTLGLRHNFAGSTSRTIKELMDPMYCTEHGISSSVMDYIPMNVWSTMSVEEIHESVWSQTHVGEYDIIAIAYGYKVLDDEIPGEKHTELEDIGNSSTYYGSDEEMIVDENPFVQIGDLSDDPLSFYKDRVELIARLRNETMDKIMKGESWMKLWDYEKQYMASLASIAKRVCSYVGGVETYRAYKGKDFPHGAKVLYMSKEKHKEAVDLTLSIMLGEGKFFPLASEYSKYITRIGTDGVQTADVVRAISELQRIALEALIGNQTVEKITKRGSGATMKLEDYLTYIKEHLFAAKSEMAVHPQHYFDQVVSGLITSENVVISRAAKAVASLAKKAKGTL